MAIITLGANAITALPAGVGGKVLQVTDTFTDQTTTSAIATFKTMSITHQKQCK
jgi:hypothetical protein